MTNWDHIDAGDTQSATGSGITESQFAPFGGPRVSQFSIPLFFEPNAILSDNEAELAGGQGRNVSGGGTAKDLATGVNVAGEGIIGAGAITLAATTSFKEIVKFKKRQFPWSITPCIRFSTGDGASAVQEGAQFQFRLTGRNLRGEQTVETTPMITIPDFPGAPPGQACFYTWFSKPVQKVEKLEFNSPTGFGATGGGQHRFAVGFVHPLQLTLGALNSSIVNEPHAPIPTYTDAGITGADTFMLGGNAVSMNDAFNYGIEMPYDIDGSFNYSTLASAGKPETSQAVMTVTGGSLWNLSALITDIDDADTSASSTNSNVVVTTSIDPFSHLSFNFDADNEKGGYFSPTGGYLIGSGTRSGERWGGAARKLNIFAVTDTYEMKEVENTGAPIDNGGDWAQHFRLDLTTRTNIRQAYEGVTPEHPVTGFTR